MATLEELIQYTRLELTDNSDSFQASVHGDGVTMRYDLPDAPIDAVGLDVFIDNNGAQTVLSSPGGYTMDYENGVITLAEPLADGARLTVQGTTYTFFSDTKMAQFVDIALLKHTHNSTTTMATLPPVEKHLVAILATIEALWVLATDASYDINVYTPEGVSIPKEQRFAQLMRMIEGLRERYRYEAQLLNVGLGRIQVLTLRRKSRQTGRLVPVYTPQEIDDRRKPQRVYPIIEPPGPTERPAHLPPEPDWWGG